MVTLELNKIPNTIENEVLSIINQAFRLSKPLQNLRKYVERTSQNSIRIGEEIIDLSKGNLYVLGWGKVSGAMAHAIENILGPEIIKDGIVVTSNSNYNTEKIKILKGTHPLPSEQNIEATKQILSLAKECTENDHVISLVSGGGSAILCMPAEGITLHDKIATTNVLLQEGIEVEQINRIRKHISAIKGGKLAKTIYPARITNLIVSDDIKDAIHSIGSGPTVSDPITFKGAQEIIDNYLLRDKLPRVVIDYIDNNVGKTDNETLKASDPASSKISSHIVFSNEVFRENLKKVAENLGNKNIFIYPEIISGDFNESLEEYRSFIKKINQNEDFIVIAGGEVEVKNKQDGKGGRAQHFAAGMIPFISKYNNAAFAAVASDGNDYLTGVGGALVTSKTQNNLLERNISYETYFKDTKSFNIHKSLGSHLLTKEPTQNNVFDLYIFLNRKKVKMKALICAAGNSRRMGELTKNTPKPLLQLGEKTLIENLLDSLTTNPKIDEVIILTGYLEEKIKEKIGESYNDKKITYITNSIFPITNNMYTLLLARNYIDSDILFVSADVFLTKESCHSFINADAPNSLFTSFDPMHFNDPDPVKVSIREGRITQIDKKLPLEEVDSVAVGMYKLSKETFDEFCHIARYLFEKGNHNYGYIEPIKILLHRTKFIPVKVNDGEWGDIDTPEEYETLKKRFQKIN